MPALTDIDIDDAPVPRGRSVPGYRGDLDSFRGAPGVWYWVGFTQPDWDIVVGRVEIDETRRTVRVGPYAFNIDSPWVQPMMKAAPVDPTTR